MNCSCLIISLSELILMYELINYMYDCVIGYYLNICMVIYLHVLYELLKWHHNAFHMHWGSLEIR